MLFDKFIGSFRLLGRSLSSRFKGETDGLDLSSHRTFVFGFVGHNSKEILSLFSDAENVRRISGNCLGNPYCFRIPSYVMPGFGCSLAALSAYFVGPLHHFGNWKPHFRLIS